MTAVTVDASTTNRPPTLYLDMTGETFEFQTSAKTGDGMFRFRWTLDGGKKGPPEHVHDDEAETFTIVSGTLRIWIAGTPRDLGAGESVTVEPGTRHRFFNPGTQPVVVDVRLNGTRMEDALVPLAIHANGRRKIRVGDFFVLMAHGVRTRGSHAPGKIADLLFSGLGRFCGLFAKKLPLAPGWQ